MHCHQTLLFASTALLSSLAAAASSSTTASEPVITVWFLEDFAGGSSIDVSLASANPSETILVYSCDSTSPPSTSTASSPTATTAPLSATADPNGDTDDACVAGPITITAGSSTFAGSYAMPDTSTTVTYFVDCKVSGTTAATCTAGASVQKSYTSSTTSVLREAEVRKGFQGVTVTAGQANLAGTTGVSTTSSGSGTSSASSTGAAATMGGARKGLVGVGAAAAAVAAQAVL